MPQPKSHSVRILPAKNNKKSAKKTMLHLLIGFIVGVIFCAGLVFIFKYFSANTTPKTLLHHSLNNLDNNPSTPSGRSNQDTEIQTSHKASDQVEQQPIDARHFQAMPQPTPVNETELSHLFKHPSVTAKPVDAIAISPFKQIQQQQAQRSIPFNKRLKPENQPANALSLPKQKPYTEDKKTHPNQAQAPTNTASALTTEAQQADDKTIENKNIATESSDDTTIDKTPPVKILITLKPKEN